MQGNGEIMKKKKREAKNQKAKSLKAVIYIRVDSVEQLNLKEQQNYFNSKLESVQKGEECDADNDSEKEKYILHTTATGV